MTWMTMMMMKIISSFSSRLDHVIELKQRNKLKLKDKNSSTKNTQKSEKIGILSKNI